MCCPLLQRLRLGFCHNVSDNSAQCLRRLRNVKELDLSMTCVSEQTCLSLAKMESLSRLNLDASKVNDKGIQNLLNTLSLKQLNIRSIDLSLQTLRLLTKRAPALETNLELSTCIDLGFPSAFVCGELKRKGSISLDDCNQYNSTQMGNFIWGF